MHCLEIIEVLKDCGALSRRFVYHLSEEVSKGALLKEYLVLPLSKIVKNSVDAGDHTTSIVESSCLLHVEIINDRKIPFYTVFSALEELSIYYHGNDRLRDEA